MNSFNDIGFPPEFRNVNLGLPPIRGKWFAVDPYATGERPDGSVADLKTAYDLCVSGRGDGILLYSGGTGTASQTTSYLSAPLAWSKHGITVLGLAAPSAYFGRARISNVEHTTGTDVITIAFPTATTITDSAAGFLTAGFAVGDVLRIAGTGSGTNDSTGNIITAVTAGTITCAASTFSVVNAATTGSCTISSYNAQMITVSGSNNAFYNIHVSNGSSDALALGAVSVTGNRNYFKNCHFIGTAHATPAAVATAYDLQLVASECVFDDCYFGTNSTTYAAANGHIKLGLSTTAIGQCFFNRCRVISNSATSTHGAINVTNAATIGGYIHFNDCTFVNWQSGAKTALTTAIIGATPNNAGILLHNCGMVGWAAWGANDDTWFTTNAVGAAGTGGIAGNIA